MLNAEALENGKTEAGGLKLPLWLKKQSESCGVAVARVVLLGIIIALWEVAAQNGWINSFLMGSPLNIYRSASAMIASGQLFTDIQATVYATIIGFVIGSLLGSVSGLLLWYSRFVAQVIDPLIVSLNGIPKIALAPMIVIWFGTDIFSKVVLAFISTFVVALLSAYQATHQIEPMQISMLKAFGATRTQIFTKVIVPSSLPWIVSAFRINIGLALVSVVGGEFISSDRGLGHMVFVEGNLFNIPAVWVGVLALVLVAMALYCVVGYAENHLIPWSHKTAN